MRRWLLLLGALWCGPVPAEAPVLLSTGWDTLAVPVGNDRVVRVDEAHLELRHDGAGYTARLSARLTLDDTPLGRWLITGQGDAWGRFDLQVEADPLHGAITGSGRVDWRSGLSWDAVLAAIGLRLETLLPAFTGPTDLTLRGTGRRPTGADIRIEDLRSEIYGASLTGGGRLDAGEHLALDARLALAGLDYGKLSIPTLSAELALHRQALEAELTAPQSIVAGIELGGWQARLQGQTPTGERPPELQLSATFEQAGLGPLQGRIRFLDAESVDWRQRPVAGELHAELSDFAVLEEALPAFERLAGRLEADLELSGTLAAPRYAGIIELREGRIDVLEYGVSLTDLSLRAQGRGDTVALSGSARSGEGRIEMQGLAQLASEPRTELAIEGENVLVLNIPEARVAATPNLAVEIAGRRITVGGRLDIPRAEIELLDSGPTLEPSDDVVFVDPQADRRDGEDLWNLHADVDVALGEAVRVQSAQFQGRLTGELRVKDHPDRTPRARGELRIVDASASAYGTELTIESGRLNYLDTPVDDPALDVIASRTIGSVSAGVRVGGHASAPEFELFSRPPMNDTDILAYLVLGRPANRVSGEEGAALLSVATRLAFRNGSVLTGSLQRQFGLDELTLESGADTEEARVVAGKYLAPRLYLNLGVGLFEPVRTLTLSYQLTRRLTVEATAGTTTGADVIYELERP